MGIIAWIVVGLIAGSLAGQVMKGGFCDKGSEQNLRSWESWAS
jgi:uncharacterized membrane protein YeaQ/YmgE (transglycosylase-associated protein family)